MRECKGHEGRRRLMTNLGMGSFYFIFIYLFTCNGASGLSSMKDDIMDFKRHWGGKRRGFSSFRSIGIVLSGHSKRTKPTDCLTVGRASLRIEQLAPYFGWGFRFIYNDNTLGEILIQIFASKPYRDPLKPMDASNSCVLALMREPTCRLFS